MDRNYAYEIFPQSGVYDIKFGMSASDVENLWGAPTRTSKNYLGDKTEVRDGAVVTYSQTDGGVAEIGFPSSYSNVVIQGVKIFQQPDQTIRELRALDQDAYEGDGFIVFNTLGVSLSGFRGGDPKALTVTAFKHGRWDKSIRDMNRLS
ncbi:hypothetical protein ACT2E5_14855 [Burkholderia vietnamiensis]|uniref:hypothetical protein n=1 Tax=Burkholderia vietnamiensis TaxID=60552 RepID=UPI001B9ED92E|nr:hypothetical protein [Burkholderia vietnamiensis]MBR8219629.1 hypothetical protein [Burkholderia vietnamiensis]HDR9083779.1 hypothetical protein [Burkholderia vietnamiensis]